MRKWACLIVPLLLASFACSVAVSDDQAGRDTRPIVEQNELRIVFLSPNSGSRYALGAWVLLYAEALDTGAGITKIEFYDSLEQVISVFNSTNPQGDHQLTALVTWQPTTPQIHLVTAKAFRADGTQSNTAEISVEVVTSQSAAAPPSPAIPQPVQTEEASDASSAAPAAPQTADSQAAVDAAPTVAAPAPSTLTATVSAEALNVRVAPNTTAEIASAALTTGTQIQLVGRSQDGLWYATPLASGGVGWVFAEALTVDGDPAGLPLAAAP